MDLLREAIDGRVGEDPPVDWAMPGTWLEHFHRDAETLKDEDTNAEPEAW